MTVLLAGCSGLLGPSADPDSAAVSITNGTGEDIVVHFGSYTDPETNTTVAETSALLDGGAIDSFEAPADQDLNIWYTYEETATNTTWYVRLVDGSGTLSVFNMAAGSTHILELGSTTYTFDGVSAGAGSGATDSAVQAPQISPNGGSVLDTDTITLTCGTTDAAIYYTLDGRDPTSASTLYGGPFSLSADSQVRAIAYKDGLSASPVTSASFTVTASAPVNQAPIADAGTSQSVAIGGTVTLTASASTDPDGDSLTYSWSFSGAPEASAATLSGASTDTPTFVPDAYGRYDLAVSVSDGSDSDTATVSVSVHGGYQELSGNVVDAEYDAVGDRIIMAMSSPNQLLAYDPQTGAELACTLSSAPTAVSVAPDGGHAAVGHDGAVSYVDLSTMTVVRAHTLDTSTLDSYDTAFVFDIALDSLGNAHISFRDDQWTHIRSVDLSTGTESETTDMIYDSAYVALHPAGNSLYTSDTGTYPEDLERWAVSAGTATELYDSQYHGDYDMGGRLWITEDGRRALCQRGATTFELTESGANTSDITYAGTIPGLTMLEAAGHSTEAGTIAVIQSDSYEPDLYDGEVALFSDQNLSAGDRWALPEVVVSGTAYGTHGRFVFYNSGGTSLFVIVQADGTAGLLDDFAVVTY